MDAVLVVVGAGAILLVVCFGILFRKLINGNGHVSTFFDDEQSIFSPTRYREMERLLDVKLSFQQDGSTYELRKERADVLRSYIRQLSHDFYHICRALKLVMVNSQVDRPDLARTLMKQQFRFTFTIMAVRFRLILYRFGWSGVGVDALTKSLRSVCLQLQTMAAIAQPEAAYY
jgi:hypothetical protein